MISAGKPMQSFGWSSGALRAPAPILARIAAFSALLAFSFALVWVVGRRGLFLLDQSIVFDGAWRLVQGQVPYKDFLIPFGPVTFVVQAFMFRLFGVTFSTMVLTAAVLSVMATAAAARLLWLLAPRSSPVALLGGLLTAVWFQAPFGIPWMEQTAFLLDLVSLLAIVEARLAAPRPNAIAWRHGVLHVLAGIAFTGAVLSKQNAGGLFLPVCVGAIALPWRGRSAAALRGLLAFALGAAFAAALFTAWLRACSDVNAFDHYWFDVASHTGLRRIVADYWRVLGAFFFQPMTSGALPLLLLSAVAGGAGLLFALRSPDAGAQVSDLTLCSWLALALPEFQSVFQLTTNNDAANGNPYLGICVGCTLALALRALRGNIRLGWTDGPRAISIEPDSRILHLAALAVLAVLSIYSVVEGLIVDYFRTVQEFAPDVRFADELDVPGASGITWGDPTRTTPRFCESIGEMCKISRENAELERPLEVLHKEDFERLALTLRNLRQNFFVFPDATMLYGMTGRPSPQPVLYFHPNQSFLVDDEAKLDGLIVDSLVRHQVTLVVLERAAFMGTQKLLPSFPRLKSWIEDNFVPIDDFGNYRLLAAKPGSPPASGASALAGEREGRP
jgi:hypothetical protein